MLAQLILSTKNVVSSQLHKFVSVILGQAHIDAICDHLEAITYSKLSRLVINIPPGCMKSLAACVFWPAWVRTFRPESKWIFASYVMVLSSSFQKIKRPIIGQTKLTEA